MKNGIRAAIESAKTLTVIQITNHSLYRQAIKPLGILMNENPNDVAGVPPGALHAGSQGSGKGIGSALRMVSTLMIFMASTRCWRYGKETEDG